MTTITRFTEEQLIEKLQHRIAVAANYPGVEEAELDATIFKITLTSLEREQVRREHAEWSDATFGDVGPVGPLKHLFKEAREAAAEPGDLSEWADMQFLLWDAQRRAGISDEQITHAMVEKLAINKTRQWPEPKDGEPRLHIKEQPAQVVPDDLVKAFISAIEKEQDRLFGEDYLMDSKDCVDVIREEAQRLNSCRASMLQGGAK
ncbi:DUF550 domain-containing protein [Salmonella enterica]|nr:DUF550 domain-containing protein [Salmonella enterica]